MADTSQEGEGARYGVPAQNGLEAVSPCRAWFTSLTSAMLWARENMGEVWDLVEGKRVQ